MLKGVGALNALGDKPVERIKTDDLETCFQHLKTVGRAGSTYNHYRQLLQLMFAWALRKGYLQRNPFSDAELPRQQQAKRSRRLMTDEESKLLHAATPRIYRLIVGALETACRLGELLALPTFKKAWQVTLLRASGYQPEWTKGRLTDACRQQIAENQSICTSTTCGTKPDRGGSRVGCRFTT